MHSNTTLRKIKRHDPHNQRPPIPSLRHILPIAQRQHQLVIHGRHMLQPKPLPPRALGKRKPWQRRRDDVVRLLPSRRIRERVNDPLHLEEVPRPPVLEEQRDGALALAAVVHEVDRQRLAAL